MFVQLLQWVNTKKYGTVRIDGRGNLSIERTQILVSPQVADRAGAGQTKVR